MPESLHSLAWPNSFAEAKTQQLALRERVILEDQLDLSAINTVAGVDVAFRDGGKVTFAAVVLMRFPSCELLQQATAELPTAFPYVPGYLSFRELPAIVAAWQKLSETPDLALCDGQGIAHPRRFGLACHLGVLLDVPSIGVAKSRLVGDAPQPLLEKGQKQPLVYNEQRVGWLLRSRTGVKPLYISPGHKVSIAKCCQPVVACCTKFRLPEPTRIADKLSKTRT